MISFNPASQIAATNSLTSIGAVSAATSLAAQAGRGIGPESAALLNRVESGGIAAARIQAPSWTQRIKSVASGLILGAALMTGCTFQPGGVAPGDGGGSDAGTVSDGGPDSSSDGGHGGDGGMDGGALPAGPSITRPTMGQILAPSQAFVLMQNGAIPAGRTVQSYQLCSTTGPSSGIDGDTECPNSIVLSVPRTVLTPLVHDTTTILKARARFDNGTYSAYSGLLSFLANNVQMGWWHLDGNGDDASGRSHAGTAQNGATFGTGRISQALSLDGMNDHMTIPNSDDHNFGTGDFTLSAWVRPSRNGVAEAIIAKRSATNGYELYRTAGGALAFYGSNCGIAVSGGSLPSAQWHRIAAVRSGGMVSLYVEDALVGTAACADNFANSAALTFGCTGPDLGCAEPFQGAIDEVIVRNLASNAAAVVNDYCADQVLILGAATLPAACQ